MICFSLSNLRRLQHHGSALAQPLGTRIATYPCNLHSSPPPQSRKRSEIFEQRISELILRSANFPGYLGTTWIEPDNLGNRRYVFRFADQESLERWFNSPERRDCLARLDPLTDGIPSYEPVYGEQALWTLSSCP